MTLDQDLITLIRSLELELLNPQVRKSVDRLSVLLADEFVEIGTSGTIYRKEDILRLLPAGRTVDIAMRDFRAMDVMPDTILVMYRVEEVREETGERRRSLRSSLWRNRSGKWEIVFHQGTQQTP